MTIQDLITKKILQPSEMVKIPIDDNKQWIPFVYNHDYPAVSPGMWNKVFAEKQLPYQSFSLILADASNLPQLIEAMKADPKIIGAGFGFGLKDIVVPLITVDQKTQLIGAVNITAVRDGEVYGTNTDGFGLVTALVDKAQEVGNQKKTVIVLSAGGTGRPISFELADRGYNPVIINRTVSKAEKLAEQIAGQYPERLVEFHGREDISGIIAKHQPDLLAIVNAVDAGGEVVTSPLGSMDPGVDSVDNLNESREIMESLPEDVIIVDILLRDKMVVPLLRQAALFGLPRFDGRPMVLSQAIGAFQHVMGDQVAANEIKAIMEQEI